MIKPSPQFYTATMAKLFADQGYLRKAAEIYRHLISRNPAQRELRQALEQVERRMAELPAPTRKDTELLLREWIELIKEKRRQNGN